MHTRVCALSCVQVGGGEQQGPERGRGKGLPALGPGEQGPLRKREKREKPHILEPEPLSGEHGPSPDLVDLGRANAGGRDGCRRL